MWGALFSDLKKFCIPLQLENTVDSAPHKYFLNFTKNHLTAAAYPKKTFFDFSSGVTVYLEMNEIGRGCIPSRDFSNPHLTFAFYCASNFIEYTESYVCTSTAPISSFYQSILM